MEGMPGEEETVSDFDDLPDLADGDDRPGIEDDLDYFDETSDDFEDDDYPDDATDEDLDYAVAVYREDGVPSAQPLPMETVNDLEELIAALRRFPGDGGAMGVISIMEEFFVLVRVRGKHVQTVLSDAFSADDWPIARDVADYLNADVPDEDDDDDDPLPVGDLAVLADLGLPEFDLQALITELDEGPDEIALILLDKIGFGEAARAVVEAEFN
jgi:putative tRNA adenosine deaminase-associated protein